MSKTIFVSGAAGFIGSHVSQAFLARGDKVVALDDLNDYYSPARKQANLQELQLSSPTPGALVFVPGDIRDRQLVSRIFAAHSFDTVIHLAAMPGVRISMDNPHLYYDVNLIGTLNLLEAARMESVGNFVFASTSSVYGNTRQIPFVETDTCDRPLAPYPATKRAAELLCFTYHHLYALNCTVLRFFTVYGPRSRPDMMAAKVVDNIFFGRPVPLYNEGQMHRDWTYVGDIVQGVVAAADRPLGYEVINLGRGEPILLADFVGLIEELAGHKARLLPAPMPETDMPYTYANIKKAQAMLGYHPTISVREGVSRYWHWYQRTMLQEVDHRGPALAA